jgi:hypothetical protein
MYQIPNANHTNPRAKRSIIFLLHLLIYRIVHIRPAPRVQVMPTIMSSRASLGSWPTITPLMRPIVIPKAHTNMHISGHRASYEGS